MDTSWTPKKSNEKHSPTQGPYPHGGISPYEGHIPSTREAEGGQDWSAAFQFLDVGILGWQGCWQVWKTGIAACYL